MPIYEFSCENCGHQFEDIVMDDSIPTCPKCGANSAHRLISAGARRKKAGMPFAASADYAGSTRSLGGGGCSGCSGGNCASCGS